MAEQRIGNEIILDWDKYIEKARETVAEGCVLLKNENQVLPLADNTRVALFGRMQNHYYKSGVGSGGMVNVETVTGILEGIENCGTIQLDNELIAIYKEFERYNPYDEGGGWGREPWSQPEMPLEDQIVRDSAKRNDVAICIIARTAGEDRDATETEGSYDLTKLELDMLRKVRAYFDKMVVLVNSGGIINLAFLDDADTAPDSLLMVWQGGMVGGDGVCDLLTGAKNPSGKLVDTIPYRIADHPATKDFGSNKINIYTEDIYVGYRYFETFDKAGVRFPFGFGLSYSSFEICVVEEKFSGLRGTIKVSVKNVGSYAGKEVVQVYGEPPQGLLGKPVRNLLAYKKTRLLSPGEEQELSFTIYLSDLASYDDSGKTGHPYCKLLEEGQYIFYVGSDVRNAKACSVLTLEELYITETLDEAYAPVTAFDRITCTTKEIEGKTFYVVQKEATPLATRSKEQVLEDSYAILPLEGKKNDNPQASQEPITLEDVYNQKVDMTEFVASLKDVELCSLVSGEGMSSQLVTMGTAAAFGGVSKSLRDKKVPAVCCADGPSGIRMDCGTKAFSLPNGTLLGCTFNQELVEELYTFTGMELAANKIECLLGPGINIHRHPLNGRNFEYFSEDPYVTGTMAIAQLKAFKKSGVTGVLKHFCGNNQETGRRCADTVISERALREIYLKAFEMCVKQAEASAIMSTYGVVNSVRTAESYDLCTKILRNEWGYRGIVMTDWWANISRGDDVSAEDGYEPLVASQNDIFMVTPDGGNNDYIDRTLELLAERDAEIGEYRNATEDKEFEESTVNELRAMLQRAAVNICQFVMETNAMKRLLGILPTYKIVGRKEEEAPDDLSNATYEILMDYIEVDLSYKESKMGTNYLIPVAVQREGTYEVVLTASSDAEELAQIPCSLYSMGTPVGTFTFHGTNGKTVSIAKNAFVFKNNVLFRLYVGAAGVKLEKMSIRYLKEDMDI